MKYLDYGLVLLFTIANAFEFLLIKGANLNIYVSGMIMFGTACVLLNVVLFLRRDYRPLYSHIPIKTAFIIGIISFTVNILWLKGLEYTSATNATLLGKTDVAFSLLFSFVLLHEKIKRRVLIFVGIMIVGILFVMNVSFNNLSSLNFGDICVISSAMLLAFNAFLVREILKSTRPFEIATINCSVNVVGFALLFFIKGLYTQPYSLSSISISFLAGFVCFLFFCGYYSALKIFPLWEVRTLALLVPIFTITGDLLFFHERLSFSQCGGIGLVLLGVVGIILYEKK